MSKKRIVIYARELGDPDIPHWEVDVRVNGENVGGGTGPTASSALDVAMDVLYGDKNDWINDDFGALSHAGIK